MAKKEVNLAEQLEKSFQRWDYLREHGGSDPLYDDATNMNLVRNHIIYEKHEIEYKYGRDYEKYPAIYFRETPPETNRGYMTNAAAIREGAAQALDSYLQDANFYYLLTNKELLTEKEAEKISLYNVLGYASGLATALKEDDLITMRRHAYRPEGYQESFASCAEKMKEVLKEKQQEAGREGAQLSLFTPALETGQSR